MVVGGTNRECYFVDLCIYAFSICNIKMKKIFKEKSSHINVNVCFGRTLNDLCNYLDIFLKILLIFQF